MIPSPDCHCEKRSDGAIQHDFHGPLSPPAAYFASAFKITGTSINTLLASANCSICVLIPAAVGVSDTVKT